VREIELVEFITKALVKEPSKVVLEHEEKPDSLLIKLSVAKEDMGRVIGKEGKTAKAIRILANAAATKEHKRVVVDILD